MRYFILVLAFLAPTLGFSQTTVVSGYADNYVPEPGMYAAPFVPRVSTPVASFATPPLQVGARNATEGNVAGAGNTTAGQDSALMSTDFVPSGFLASPSREAPRKRLTGARPCLKTLLAWPSLRAEGHRVGPRCGRSPTPTSKKCTMRRRGKVYRSIIPSSVVKNSG